MVKTKVYLCIKCLQRSVRKKRTMKDTLISRINVMLMRLLTTLKFLSYCVSHDPYFLFKSISTYCADCRALGSYNFSNTTRKLFYYSFQGLENLICIDFWLENMMILKPCELIKYSSSLIKQFCDYVLI